MESYRKTKKYAVSSMMCIVLIKISKLKILYNNTLEFIVVTNVRFVMHYDSNLTNVEIYITGFSAF